MICYDCAFPRDGAYARARGRECVSRASGWFKAIESGTLANDDQSARTWENGCYVVAPDQTGNIYIGQA